MPFLNAMYMLFPPGAFSFVEEHWYGHQVWWRPGMYSILIAHCIISFMLVCIKYSITWIILPCHHIITYCLFCKFYLLFSCYGSKSMAVFEVTPCFLCGALYLPSSILFKCSNSESARFMQCIVPSMISTVELLRGFDVAHFKNSKITFMWWCKRAVTHKCHRVWTHVKSVYITNGATLNRIK